MGGQNFATGPEKAIFEAIFVGFMYILLGFVTNCPFAIKYWKNCFVEPKLKNL